MLSDHGITRQRLEGFDRAITTPPQFFRDKKARGAGGERRRGGGAPARARPQRPAQLLTPRQHAPGSKPLRACRPPRPPHAPTHTRPPPPRPPPPPRAPAPAPRPPAPTAPPPQDALIREFSNYLGILKAVHSGADLQASAAAVGSSLPQAARGYLGYVTGHIGDSQILPFIEAAVEARTEIARSLTGNKCAARRRAARLTPARGPCCGAAAPPPPRSAPASRPWARPPPLPPYKHNNPPPATSQPLTPPPPPPAQGTCCTWTSRWRPACARPRSAARAPSAPARPR